MCVHSLAETADANKPDFSGIIKNVEMLGCDDIPEWERDSVGLHIKMKPVQSEYPITFKIMTG